MGREGHENNYYKKESATRTYAMFAVRNKRCVGMYICIEAGDLAVGAIVVRASLPGAAGNKLKCRTLTNTI